MALIEIEKTFLLIKAPEWVNEVSGRLIIDTYFPESADHHPKLRVRQDGDKYELTKKSLIDPSDASQQYETTVELSEAEFNCLVQASSRKLVKTRYSRNIGDISEDVDVFHGPLEGLILVDLEFACQESIGRSSFPEYCLVDVTQEDFIAGGMLAGKSLQDISQDLSRLGCSI